MTCSPKWTQVSGRSIQRQGPVTGSLPGLLSVESNKLACGFISKCPGVQPVQVFPPEPDYPQHAEKVGFMCWEAQPTGGHCMPCLG